ncbi:hypothetical protein DFP73DRAFT_525613 [Morchella snyderi]|nr:hypothetical protein DFP73DRAFT_525613 [Morchella snyderi]
MSPDETCGLRAAAPFGAIMLARQETIQRVSGSSRCPPRRRTKMVRDVNGAWVAACILRDRDSDAVAFNVRIRAYLEGLRARQPQLEDEPPECSPAAPVPTDHTTPAGNSGRSIAYGRYVPRVTLLMFFTIILFLSFLSRCYAPSGVLPQSSATVGQRLWPREDDVRDSGEFMRDWFKEIEQEEEEMRAEMRAEMQAKFLKWEYSVT